MQIPDLGYYMGVPGAGRAAGGAAAPSLVQPFFVGTAVSSGEGQLLSDSIQIIPDLATTKITKSGLTSYSQPVAIPRSSRKRFFIIKWIRTTQPHWLYSSNNRFCSITRAVNEGFYTDSFIHSSR